MSHSFFCGFGWSASGYCLQVFCFALLLFSWFSERAGTFLSAPIGISGLLAASALCPRDIYEAKGKPRELTTMLFDGSQGASLASVPSLHAQSLFFFFF